MERRFLRTLFTAHLQKSQLPRAMAWSWSARARLKLHVCRRQVRHFYFADHISMGESLYGTTKTTNSRDHYIRYCASLCSVATLIMTTPTLILSHHPMALSIEVGVGHMTLHGKCMKSNLSRITWHPHQFGTHTKSNRSIAY